MRRGPETQQPVQSDVEVGVQEAYSSSLHLQDRIQDDGYAIIKGVFSPEDVDELRRAFDRTHALALSYRASYRYKNTYFQLTRDSNLGRIVRFAQWPSYQDATLASYRTDTRIFSILQPLIGSDIKQIINQLHWKPPGAARAEFGFHQDITFRRPRCAYRNPESAYLQMVIAIDAHREENGAIAVLPRSHLLGELTFPGTGRILNRTLKLKDLEDLGLDPSGLVFLELDPGDVALWTLFTVHGSGPNTSTSERRAYINGYVRAADCDRGEWAFRHGAPCPLGEPALVHYDELYTRPGPFYVDPT
jgi:ectoine hydroxylase-related dioxygenase (phytanoyl-CoA dioxygenase family)